MSWFAVVWELERNRRDDVEGLATLFGNHVSGDANLIDAYRG